MSHYRSQNLRTTLHLGVLFLLALVLAGCTTRQVSTVLEGSTAQRLVTLSLDKFIEDLAKQPEIVVLEAKTAHLDVYFLTLMSTFLKIIS